MSALTNQDIGANLRSARELGGMSQARLALLMIDLGFNWAQTTVWNVERGERPLRLNEAVAVAQILDLHLDVLVYGRMREESEWAWRAGVATGSLMRVQKVIQETLKELP